MKKVHIIEEKVTAEEVRKTKENYINVQDFISKEALEIYDESSL